MKAKHTQRLACRSYAEHDTRHGVGQIIRFTCRWIVREARNHANLFLFHEIIDGFLKWNSCSGYTFWIMPGVPSVTPVSCDAKALARCDALPACLHPKQWEQ